MLFFSKKSQPFSRNDSSSCKAKTPPFRNKTVAYKFNPYYLRVTVPIENHQGEYLCHPRLDAMLHLSSPCKSLPEQGKAGQPWKKEAEMPTTSHCCICQHKQGQKRPLGRNLFTKKFSISFVPRYFCQPTVRRKIPIFLPSFFTRTHGNLAIQLSSYFINLFQSIFPHPAQASFPKSLVHRDKTQTQSQFFPVLLCKA